MDAKASTDTREGKLALDQARVQEERRLMREGGAAAAADLPRARNTDELLARYKAKEPALAKKKTVDGYRSVDSGDEWNELEIITCPAMPAIQEKSALDRFNLFKK